MLHTDLATTELQQRKRLFNIKTQQKLGTNIQGPTQTPSTSAVCMSASKSETSRKIVKQPIMMTAEDGAEVGVVGGGGLDEKIEKLRALLQEGGAAPEKVDKLRQKLRYLEFFRDYPAHQIREGGCPG